MRVVFVLIVAVFAALARRPNQHKPAFPFLGQLEPKVRYAGFCDYNPPDSVLHNLTITNARTKSTISGFFSFTREINNVTKAIILIRRCTSPEDKYSCEHFHTWRFGKETCDMIPMKNQIWSTSFDAIHPAIKCPIKKGDYKMVNGTADIKTIQSVFNTYPIEKYFWRVQLDAYDYKMFVCVVFGIGFVR